MKRKTLHKSPLSKKQKSHKAGHRAEVWAALVLRLKGYRICEMRYKTPVGEIDIIAQKSGCIVAVEVKLRRQKTDALYAISAQAQNRITRAMQHYLMTRLQYSDFDVRFDVIAFSSGWFAPFRFTHLDNA